MEHLSRTSLILGEDAVRALRNCRIAIFGVGGVGGHAMEALARTGIGTLDLIDSDTISVSNLNRQIIATRENLGRLKVDVAKERIHSIDPETEVNAIALFYLPDTAGKIPFEKYDYIVDATDTVAAKVDLVLQAKKYGIPIISAMGCGNRMSPEKLVCTDIYKTETDPLARIMRKELRARDVVALKVVYSTETPIRPARDSACDMEDSFEANSKEATCESRESKEYSEPMPGGTRFKRMPPGSNAFVPGAAGLLIASQVIKDLTEFEE